MSQPGQQLPTEVANEWVRQAEVRLGAILTVALAADARANTLCSTMGAAAIAVLAALASNATSEHPAPRLVIPGLILASGLLLGAAISALAGAPREFRLGGGNPADLRPWTWNTNSLAWRSQSELLDATGQRYAKAIDTDIAILKRQGTRVQAALGIALATVIIAFLVFLKP